MFTLEIGGTTFVPESRESTEWSIRFYRQASALILTPNSINSFCDAFGDTDAHPLSSCVRYTEHHTLKQSRTEKENIKVKQF